MVAIVVAFWGVFLVSLFVVSLQNMLEFDDSQSKAYSLLTRLITKDHLKEQAAGMMVSSYRLFDLKNPVDPKTKKRLRDPNYKPDPK